MRVAGESLTLSSARREYGLVAGDQSAARLARVIIGHVGGNVHTEAVARELVVHSYTTHIFHQFSVLWLWALVLGSCALATYAY